MEAHKDWKITEVRLRCQHGHTFAKGAICISPVDNPSKLQEICPECWRDLVMERQGKLIEVM